MVEEKTPGLLLHSLSHLGQKKIFKVLTPSGLITLLVKSSSLSPFCKAEFVYRQTQKEIYTLCEATLLDPLLELRRDYDTLSAAGSMAQNLLRTQLPNKCAPFDLAYAYFKKIPLNPSAIAASFCLKLLLHEGLFSSELDPLFTADEWEKVLFLTNVRYFSELKEIKAPLEKIRDIFDYRTRA